MKRSKIKNKCDASVICLKNDWISLCKRILTSRSGEMYIDMVVKIVILAGLGLVFFAIVYPLIRDLLVKANNTANEKIGVIN